MNCLSCDTVEGFESIITTTKEQLYTFMGAEFLTLLNGMMLFFAVWTIFRSMAYGRSFEWAELLEQAFTALLVASALSSGFFWWPVFDLIVQVGTFMAQKVAALAGIPLAQRAGLTGFVEQIEIIIFNPVMVMTDYVSGEMSIRNLGKNLLLLIAAAVYVMLCWEMLKSVVRSYFAIQAIAFLASPLVFFYAFEDTRSITMNGLKVVMVNALRLYVGMAAAMIVVVTFNKLGTGADIIGQMNNDSLGRYVNIILTGLFMWLGYNTFMAVTGEVFMVFGQQDKLGGAGGLIKSMIDKIRN